MLFLFLALVLWTTILTATLNAFEPIVIADFESDDYGLWKVTGTAFGTRPAQGKLDGQMPV
jgi:hypothetical protein